MKYNRYLQSRNEIIYLVRFLSGLIFIYRGDMGYFPNIHELQSILSLGQQNIIFLPIGDFHSIGAKEAIETATLLNPKNITVVCHNMYGHLLVKDQFQDMIAEAPFFEHERSNLETISDKLSSNEAYKKYILFKPKSIIS